MKAITENGAGRYLAEGETPEGVEIVTVGVCARAHWRETRSRRNRRKILPAEPPTGHLGDPVRRFLCRDRIGAKIQEGADGPIVLEVAL